MFEDDVWVMIATSAAFGAVLAFVLEKLRGRLLEQVIFTVIAGVVIGSCILGFSTALTADIVPPPLMKFRISGLFAVAAGFLFCYFRHNIRGSGGGEPPNWFNR